MCTREVFACLTYHRRRHYHWLRKVWTFGATISSAVRSITAQIATLKESNYNNAPQDVAGEAIYYAIGTTTKRNCLRGVKLPNRSDEDSLLPRVAWSGFLQRGTHGR